MSEHDNTRPASKSDGPGEDPSRKDVEESSSRREVAEREAVRKMTGRTPEDLHPDPKPRRDS